jgi:riboflavin synthase
VFTGIVREVGTIDEVQRQPRGGSRITVGCSGVLPDLTEGASVNVSGVCSTVVQLLRHGFVADLSPETLARSTLGEARRGRRVNLEPSVRLDTPLGGHLVAGHVDGVGEVTLWRRDGTGILAEWTAPPEVARFLVDKGSVAVDGVSLTPYEVSGDRFRVSLIPETLRSTTLEGLAVGDRVNLEADLLAKYARKAMQPATQGVTWDLLGRAGFLD